MNILRAKIFLFLMVAFRSLQCTQSASSSISRSWKAWRGWIVRKKEPTHRTRPHDHLEDRADPSTLRGGSSDNDNDNVEVDKQLEVDEAASLPSEIPEDSTQKATPSMPTLTRKTHRCTHDVIFDLLKRSSVDGKKESIELRQLITTRSSDYLEDLRLAVEEDSKKLPHPKKLLHFLAPKVPAIKHSPDVNLRIHSARSDIDSSIAACIIGTLAHVSEKYDKQVIRRANSKEEMHSVAPELTTDRRFEQLVECILNGVNIQKRKKQSLTRQLEKSSEGVADIEQVLDEEDAHIDDGLNVRDACRAAWGISVLGCSHLESLGDVKILDLLLALSLRIREHLLARLQLIRQDDLFSDPSNAHVTTSERLNQVVEELAEDAATAMWTFACVKACTGQRSVPLFETCCSILCQDPIDMRKRAQSADYELGVPIGVHDVVDRLAEAENVDQAPENEVNQSKNETIHAPSEEMGTGKDALLDWLSPTEVNDVLWAIALHGSNNTSASDEIILSETASTLGEIAFDRLLERLEHDSMLSSNGDDGTAPSTQRIASDKDKATVAVVDAAALLASTMESNDLSNLTGEKIPVENITLAHQKDVKELEVVDAAALLASASASGEDLIETETIATCASEAVTNSIEKLSSEEAARSHGYKSSPIFTPHDLAIMAWSVTELRDPLQVRIVGMVVRLIERLGLDGTKRLGGGDLANLAWAISKSSDKSTIPDSDVPMLASNSVLSWISNNALQMVMTGRSSDGERPIRILESFQPPELGRLCWAIANTLSTDSMHSRKLKRNTEVMELARLSLEAAASNSELFATEDMLRIAWAFLELCGDDDTMINLSVSDALGSILAAVEQSLHQWERGKASTTQYDTRDTSVFSSFFGKPRLKQQLLEHALNDGEDEEESALAPILEKSRKPLLRDLTVDPTTLCKAACGYQRLSKRHPYMKGAWTLTRVAIRLLASKNARLMKECSVHDVIRLCEATVLAEVDGHGTDLVTGLFARKVLQVLNAAVDSGSKAKDSSIDMSQASSTEICTLLWSLGELGVKHHFHDDAKRSAYKRMHFVCESALLSASEIDTLKLPSVLKLLRGTVLMNYLATDKDFLCNILKAIETKYSKLKPHDACCIAESIALLKDGLAPGHLHDTSRSSGKQSVSETAQSTEVDREDEEHSVGITTETETLERREPSPQIGEASIEQDLQQSCDAILAHVGTVARKDAAILSTKDIRCLLAVYSLLPFQDDALIESLSSVVALRRTHLEQLPRESLGSLLRTARSSAESVKDAAFGHTESGSVFEQLKNGFISSFSSIQKTASQESCDGSLTAELLTSVQLSIDRASEASKSAEDLESALGLSLDSIFSSMKRGTAFELAQCEELIANYYRINFVTGTFRSRYDKVRARDIAKRVLSRLLP